MERRDLMKAVGAAAGSIAAATAVAGVSAPNASAASVEGNALVNITPPDPDAFIAGRFLGKTFIVTGSARGMGAAAAIRLAREGANVVEDGFFRDDVGLPSEQTPMIATQTLRQGHSSEVQVSSP